MKKCRHCGFENPDSANRCLNCGAGDLPTSAEEIGEAREFFGDLSRGDFGGAAGRMAKGIVTSEVEHVTTRLNPLWWLRVKLFRFKQAVIGCLAIFLIVAICVLIGMASEAIKKFFGG